MGIQVTFDAADPHALARFWADVLGYEVEDVSPFVDELVESGRLPPDQRVVVDGRSAFRDVAAARDPAGAGPRLYFQRVPEPKTAKNRVHLDVPVPVERRQDEVRRLEGRGARLLWVTDDRGPVTYTMTDPEGNEFCLH
ncbi:VOC family protein [Georgenia sp. 10Sc9-8]|uniref:VOC family protein n=1 Tax=Georgenia halotolerans TaxID=3028317 RepID=A0ABT5TYB0_9MICO|nr:VOC family protein [Georgenia halotolerans]